MTTKSSTTKNTYHEIGKWGATGFITISAILVSVHIPWATVWWAYVGFFLGHIIWAAFAAMMREWSLLALNFSFIFIDLYAIMIRL